MSENHEHVAVNADSDAMYWSFQVPSDAETCEEQTREMTGLCEQFFETFEEFLTPTEIEFGMDCFLAGHELPASTHDDAKIKTVSREVHDPEGISVDDVLAAAHTDDFPARWLPRLSFDGNKVLVELEGGPILADRTDNTVEYMNKRPLDREPTRDPIRIALLHHPNSRQPEIESKFVTSVVVHLLSDIWFEDSEIGRANARNLAAFLERIDRTLPVEKIYRSPDWKPIEQLEEIY